MSDISIQIRDFIRQNIEQHPSNIVSLVAGQFGISRQRAHALMAREVETGRVIKIGKTSNTRYFLADGNHIEFVLEIEPGLDEYQAWTKYVKPLVLRYPESIRKISSHGFSEIFNNAMDHSEGTTVYTEIKITDDTLTIRIMDNGVGIFEKIQKALNLTSDREAILHLSKGKFTTDPAHHTGLGIFFTSRIFDRFSIFSSNMFYVFEDQDWMLSKEKKEDFGQGTSIEMSIAVNSKRTVKEVMDQYADVERGFTKTIVAVALSADPGDPHVSRSQAKRLMVGLEKFRYVLLDFKGVESAGQAFVDEVFRVFQNENPNTSIEYTNANKEVDAMIKRGRATQKPSLKTKG